jgi:exopolyphosphatase/guanosine-5'-triphosphate,3'-diphosphate pyrophosphatase
VAQCDEGSLRELVSQRAFTRIGKSLHKNGSIPREKLVEIAEVVAAQSRAAREAGAERLVTVATAAVRDAPNRDELAEAVRRSGGDELVSVSGEEEARLAFVGAARTLAAPPGGQLGVIDVGGGSTEVAVGESDGRVAWSASFRIGSGFLADSYLRSDPPSIAELDAVRHHVEGCFEGLEPPRPQLAVAVGGTAASLRRLLGAELEHETLERGIRVLSSSPVAEVAERFELDPVRVHLLPAGILVLEALSDLLEMPLRVARGGLREGVIIEMFESLRAEAARPGEAAL